jgi:mRNA interferase MazF
MGRLALEPFDVVVLPFPFTDSGSTKRRPALVVSNSTFNGAQKHSVLAMITSADHSDWFADSPILDLEAAGLPQPCLVRFKLFTLDHRLVIRVAGSLGTQDRKNLKRQWKGLLAIS